MMQGGMQQTAANITNIINNNNINNFIIGDPSKVPPAALLGNLQKQQRIQSAEHIFKTRDEIAVNQQQKPNSVGS